MIKLNKEVINQVYFDVLKCNYKVEITEEKLYIYPTGHSFCWVYNGYCWECKDKTQE